MVILGFYNKTFQLQSLSLGDESCPGSTLFAVLLVITSRC